MKTPLFLVVIFSAILTIPAGAIAQTTLRYTDHEPYGNMRTRFINDVFFKTIEKESQGRLKIEAHWNGEISTSYDALKTLAEGKNADIGIVFPEYTEEQLPRYQIFKSFPMVPESGPAQVDFFHRVFQKYPQFNAELNSNNLVNLQFFLGYPVGFFTTRPGVKLERLEGTKWRTASFWHQSFLKNADGVPVKMPWDTRIIHALREGQLDGLMVNLDSGYDINAQQAAPVIQYSPSLWLGHVYLLVMNKETWNTLDKQDQEAIRRAAASTEKQLGAAQENGLTSLLALFRNQGAKLHALTRDELQRWQSATRYQQVQAEWVEQQQKKGISDAGSLMQGITTLLETQK
jgi:TRAP-type C4-dicarboxylate transport system substrate-binding protein